jgi:sterol desaturase/sphingolipid hydroxylase (fatty acid hydroxylase superfamily)
MHKVHHHFERPYTDSNYGNIFSCWDRVFGTFRSLSPEQLRYGLDTHMGEKDRIGNLLKVPFRKYRPRPK